MYAYEGKLEACSCIDTCTEAGEKIDILHENAVCAGIFGIKPETFNQVVNNYLECGDFCDSIGYKTFDFTSWGKCYCVHKKCVKVESEGSYVYTLNPKERKLTMVQSEENIQGLYKVQIKYSTFTKEGVFLSHGYCNEYMDTYYDEDYLCNQNCPDEYTVYVTQNGQKCRCASDCSNIKGKDFKVILQATENETGIFGWFESTNIDTMVSNTKETCVEECGKQGGKYMMMNDQSCSCLASCRPAEGNGDVYQIVEKKLFSGYQKINTNVKCIKYSFPQQTRKRNTEECASLCVLHGARYFIMEEGHCTCAEDECEPYEADFSWSTYDGDTRVSKRPCKGFEFSERLSVRNQYECKDLCTTWGGESHYSIAKNMDSVFCICIGQPCEEFSSLYSPIVTKKEDISDYTLYGPYEIPGDNAYPDYFQRDNKKCAKTNTLNTDFTGSTGSQEECALQVANMPFQYSHASYILEDTAVDFAPLNEIFFFIYEHGIGRTGTVKNKLPMDGTLHEKAIACNIMCKEMENTFAQVMGNECTCYYRNEHVHSTRTNFRAQSTMWFEQRICYVWVYFMESS